MKAWVLDPGTKGGHVVTISDDEEVGLEQLQTLVGGFIEAKP